MAKRNKPKTNAYEAVTDRLLAQIQAGGLPPWRKGFNTKSALYPGPRTAHNLITKKPYRGINVLLAMVSRLSNEYTTNAWLTLKQANEAGGSVRKGEKATPIVFWGVRFVDKQTGEMLPQGTQPNDDDHKKIFFARLYSLFNADQCDGLDHLLNPEGKELNQLSLEEQNAQELQIVEAFEERVRETGVDLVFRDTESAFYRPSDHMIVIPPKEQFDSLAQYFAVLTHEAGHSTGSALDRNMDFTEKKDRAMEEIVAELTSAFVASECGIDIDEARAACYIDAWSIEELLKENSKAIFMAASKAQAATEFLVTPEFQQTLAQIRDEEFMLELGEPELEIAADEALNLEDVLAFMGQQSAAAAQVSPDTAAVTSEPTPAISADAPASAPVDMTATADEASDADDIVSMDSIHDQAREGYIKTIQESALHSLKNGESVIDVGITLAHDADKGGYHILLKGMVIGSTPSPGLEPNRDTIIHALEVELGNVLATPAQSESTPGAADVEAMDDDDALDYALSAAIASLEQKEAEEDPHADSTGDEDDAFRPELYIAPAADSVEQLRKVDVLRVLDLAVEKAGEDTAVRMANYLIDHRPDLHDEVLDVMKVELSIQYPTVDDAVQTLSQTDSQEQAMTDTAGRTEPPKQTLDSFLNF
jgi:antirestriction protein ArdC